MDIQVNVHDWLALPMLTRVEMRKIFGIPRSSHTLVDGNVVKSDGTTHDDLKAITLEKLQVFLNADPEQADFVKLFNATVLKIAKDQEPPVVEKVDPTKMMLEDWAAQIARISQQATNLGLAQEFQTLISNYQLNDQRIGKASDKKGAKKGSGAAA
jgi:hypothetical protein